MQKRQSLLERGLIALHLMPNHYDEEAGPIFVPSVAKARKRRTRSRAAHKKAKRRRRISEASRRANRG